MKNLTNSDELEHIIEKLDNLLMEGYQKQRTLRITVDEHDKYDQKFRDKISEVDTKLSMLQKADDTYCDTVESILTLTQRAKEIFEGSNSEEKALLTDMVLLNLTVDNEKVCYEAKSPFNKILEYAECSSWGA